MVIFYNSISKYHALVLPIQISVHDRRGNIGLVRHYRGNKPTEVLWNFSPPSKIQGKVSEKIFDRWYVYIIENLDEENRKKTLKKIFEGRVLK